MGEEELKRKLKAEVELLKRKCEIVKRCLSGAEFSLDEVQASLTGLKDGLSMLKALCLTYTITRYGRPLDIPIEDLLHNVDLALAIMKAHPEQARAAVEVAFTLSRMKVDDVIAMLDALMGIF